MAEETPGFIHDKGLEYRGLVPVDDFVGPVQNVEQQRLQLIGDLIHALKVEGLKPCEGEVVFGMIEQRGIRPTGHPALKLGAKVAVYDVGKSQEPPLVRSDR